MQKVEEIIAGARCGYLATCRDGQARVRPMSFVLTGDGKLWSSTYDVSGKVPELEQNDRVEICFMDAGFVQLRIEGRADLTGGTEKKKRLLQLNPKVRNHFPDEHDPKYVHIEIAPVRIRWKEAGFGEYREVDPPPAR
jgi:uncharacterized pyridoxamine 5'-phosphate oxidase family protein